MNKKEKMENEIDNLGDYWRDIKKYSRIKKRKNEDNSLVLLRNRGIEVKVLNEGVSHYRVGNFDFWPTTGKFYNQKTGQKGRGVFNLIRIVVRK